MSTMRNKNYYEILEINKDSTQEEIAEAYRHLSLKYHPSKSTPHNKQVNELHFQKLAEAYEVLSDPNKKGIYDIYGSHGLRNGIVDKKGNLKGAYKFLGNGHEIFEQFMSSKNPFELVRDNEKMSEEIPTVFGTAFGGQKKEKKDGNVPPCIRVTLGVTLEEIYNGCVKSIKYKRQVMSYNMRTTEEVEDEVDVEVFKGYLNGTEIVFKGKGNEAPGQKTSDLIVKINEISDKLFKRINKNDLLYVHEISLVQALNSEPVCFTTLDGRKLAVSVDEIISPDTVKVVKGEGMPVYMKETAAKGYKIEKGDLYIKFNIVFPEYIEEDKKKKIVKLLEPEE